MKLGATVTTRKQNAHRAKGKLLILQNQRRPDRFDQMLTSCWLVFFYAKGIVHKEFVPPGQTVNQQFYLKVLKTLRDSVRKKRPEMWSSSDWFLHNAPCPHGLECAAFFGKKEHDGYPSSSLFIWPCAMRLFPVPSYERPSGKHFANVSEVKKKMPEVLNISTEEFLEMFSAVGKRLVQVYQVKRRVLWSRLEL